MLPLRTLSAAEQWLADVRRDSLTLPAGHVPVCEMCCSDRPGAVPLAAALLVSQRAIVLPSQKTTSACSGESVCNYSGHSTVCDARDTARPGAGVRGQGKRETACSWRLRLTTESSRHPVWTSNRRCPGGAHGAFQRLAVG